MKTNIVAFLIAIAVHCSDPINAQPEVDKRLPDFKLVNASGQGKMEISPNDFRGKWLFLDFWTLTCKACVWSFPKIDSLQKSFSKNVQFILVGDNSGKNNNGIAKFYEKKRKALSLTVLAAFDSVLFRKWEIGRVPTIYIVDPAGVVRFITDGSDLVKGKLQKLIQGQEVSFYDSERKESAFDFKRTRVSDLPSDKLLAYSLFTRWNSEKLNGGYDIDRFVKFPKELRDEGWSVSRVPLFGLYDFAYLGRWAWLPSDTAFYENVYRFPVLEVRDSSLFQLDYEANRATGTYNYAIKIPDEMISQDRIMFELQRTLWNTFGLDASVERRTFPVWKLILKPESAKKLQTEGGDPYLSESGTVLGFTARNQSVRACLTMITQYLPNKQELIYLDDTGIHGNIDIKLETDMTSPLAVREAIKKYDLDLVKGTKEMKVVVIRDAKGAGKAN